MALVISAFCSQEHQECIRGHPSSPHFLSLHHGGCVSVFGFVTVSCIYYLGVWGNSAYETVFGACVCVCPYVCLLLCTPAGHRERNIPTCVQLSRALSSCFLDPLCLGSMRSLDRILAPLWNQKTSELEKPLEILWFKHL